ncbi:ATP-binding cassette domain-containing protein [Kitasatospora sp. NPDC059571]|uniref:ATP-binding cassette domain-containing protein n=1 Tax=Kitasatospora sp. NPDC059571 TaxID=3346871 RepID=UPI003681A54A
MDEPTALLAATDRQRLLDLARRLADSGVAVALTTHRLDDLFAGCDTVTVLRDGRHVLTDPVSQHTPHSLARHLTGAPTPCPGPPPAPVSAHAPLALSVGGLRLPGAPGTIDLQIRAGEIVGLAGLRGSGRTRLLRALFGADCCRAGTIQAFGRTVRPGSPHHAIRAGLALVPHSRAEEGLVAARTVRENLALPSLGARQRAGLLRLRAERAATLAAAHTVALTGATCDSPLWTLSGGNQQKTVFGKWLLRAPAILLVDEPTRGVDLAARSRIHTLLTDLAGQGTAILIASLDPDELLALAHRVLVMKEGRITAAVSTAATDRAHLDTLLYADEPPHEATPW